MGNGLYINLLRKFIFFNFSMKLGICMCRKQVLRYKEKCNNKKYNPENKLGVGDAPAHSVAEYRGESATHVGREFPAVHIRENFETTAQINVPKIIHFLGFTGISTYASNRLDLKAH